jgi:hypothetical protein
MDNLKLNTSLNSTDNHLFAVIIGFYVQAVMTWLGGLLNFICILIFIRIIKNQRSNNTSGYFFEYLLLKSICDCLFCLQNIPHTFYFKADFTYSGNYLMQLWYIYCFYYLYSILSGLSVWFEVAASLDCVCLLSRTFEWHKKKWCFWAATIIPILFLILFNLISVFRFTIEKNDNGYYLQMTQHAELNSILYYHDIILSVKRDLLPLLVSIILNFIILNHLRRSTINRRNLAKNHKLSAMVRKARQAEHNKIKMTFFTSFIHLFHIPVIFYNFNILNVRSNNFTAQLCVLSNNISYIIPIITYTTFNTTFKSYFFNLFC